MKVRSFILLTMVAVLIGGCSISSSSSWNMPAGPEAYGVIPPASLGERPEYRLSPQDKLTISVFREPDLSVVEAPIEISGGMVLPLIGHVEAAGKTSSELASEIERRLGSYLVRPQVSVIVASSESLNVTVDGAVQEAGVYQMKGQTTLLQSIAMAKGASRVADLDRVAVFRTIDGKRNGAIFDVRMIQAGTAEDLVLQNGDYVMVGASNIKAVWYDVLSVLPAFALFVPLVR